MRKLALVLIAIFVTLVFWSCGPNEPQNCAQAFDRSIRSPGNYCTVTGTLQADIGQEYYVLEVETERRIGITAFEFVDRPDRMNFLGKRVTIVGEFVSEADINVFIINISDIQIVE